MSENSEAPDSDYCSVCKSYWPSDKPCAHCRSERYVVWARDDYFNTGWANTSKRTDMDPSGVTWEDSVPLVWGYSFHDPERHLYGRAVNIELVDGEITCELEFNKDEEQCRALLKNGDIVLGGFYTQIVQHENKVSSARLRAVSMVLASEIPMRRTK